MGSAERHIIDVTAPFLWLVIGGGMVAGAIVKQIAEKWLKLAWFKVRIWKLKRSPHGQQVLDCSGTVELDFRYVATVESIGTAMVAQYSGAQFVHLFIGDFDFILSTTNDNLLARLEELEHARALKIISYYSFDELNRKYSSEGARGGRVITLLEKLNNVDRFEYKNSIKMMRGSFVNYGASYTAYTFKPLNGGGIYPAVIMSISRDSRLIIPGMNLDMTTLINFLTKMPEYYD